MAARFRLAVLTLQIATGCRAAVQMAMRTLVAAIMLTGVATTALAVPHVQPRPPRPIDAATFVQLVDAVKRESFVDGKLEHLRSVAGGKRYLFTGGQVIALLDAFTFWTDRIEALRLLPVLDRNNATIVARYFNSAPPITRTEARRILSLSD